MNHNHYLKRTVIKKVITSQFLGEQRQVRVYLPPGFNELISYPIIYCQDGQDIFMYGRLATITNYLILEEDLDPAIIVGVDVDKRRRTSEYSPNGENNLKYKRFFAEELIPYIEEKYQIRQEGLQRLLIGDSLGATVSLDLALDYPDMFDSVLSLSGAFFQSTQERIRGEENLSWLSIWMLIGLQEDTVATEIGEYDFLQINRETRDLLIEKQVSVQYQEKDGTHIWGFWQKHLGEGISYFLKK